MDLVRRQEVVRQYHYDARNHEWEEKNGVPNTNIEITFRVMEKNTDENWTGLLAVMQFIVVKDEFVISGLLTQATQVRQRIIDEETSLTDEEKRELAEPLFNMVNRLTYEVTEITFDKPGIELEL